MPVERTLNDVRILRFGFLIVLVSDGPMATLLGVLSKQPLNLYRGRRYQEAPSPAVGGPAETASTGEFLSDGAPWIVHDTGSTKHDAQNEDMFPVQQWLRPLQVLAVAFMISGVSLRGRSRAQGAEVKQATVTMLLCKSNLGIISRHLFDKRNTELTIPKPLSAPQRSISRSPHLWCIYTLISDEANKKEESASVFVQTEISITFRTICSEQVCKHLSSYKEGKWHRDGGLA
jgi:hypothetical protein